MELHLDSSARVKWTMGRDIFIKGVGGGGGKRSKTLYVACGPIIRRVVAAAKCNGHFQNIFGMFCEISGPLSHAA